MVSRVFARHSLNLTVDILAPVIISLWNDGYSWGHVLGVFLAALLPAGWAVVHAGTLARGLAQELLVSEELDLADYESMDKEIDYLEEVGGSNPAVRIGALLDVIVPEQEQSIKMASRVAIDMRAALGDDWGSDAGGGDGSQAGCGLFVGRVLRQLRFAREDGEEWGVAPCIGLACALCAGPSLPDCDDWRLSRCNHAYFIGDILRQLRSGEWIGCRRRIHNLTDRSQLLELGIKVLTPKRFSVPRACLPTDWPENKVLLLVTALNSAANFPSASSTAPPRIVAEVLEGLGTRYWVTAQSERSSEYQNNGAGQEDAAASSATATTHRQ